jgi:hypothetical protein
MIKFKKLQYFEKLKQKLSILIIFFLLLLKDFSFITNDHLKWIILIDYEFDTKKILFY